MKISGKIYMEFNLATWLKIGQIHGIKYYWILILEFQSYKLSLRDLKKYNERNLNLADLPLAKFKFQWDFFPCSIRHVIEWWKFSHTVKLKKSHFSFYRLFLRVCISLTKVASLAIRELVKRLYHELLNLKLLSQRYLIITWENSWSLAGVVQPNFRS